MVIGIPRAFLYHRYHVFWETFFGELGQEIVCSPETDKDILHKGTVAAIDESCLSNKIFLGHVEWLLDKCDAIFVPRYANTGPREIFCTKFEALPDMVRNTFRKSGVRVLDTNVDVRGGKGEMGAYLALGKTLKKKRTVSLYAFMQAKWAERVAQQEEIRLQQEKLAAPGLRILVVGHGYNLYDAYVGSPILRYLEQLEATPILADVADRKRALDRSYELTETLPWLLNRELVGAVQEYRDQVDGMILASAFPCGPDSLVNDVLLRRVKELPALQLILDGQEGTAGLETRLESFVDILRMRKGEQHAG